MERASGLLWGARGTLLTWIPFTLGVWEHESGSSRRSLPGRDRSITGHYKNTPDLNPNLIGSDSVTSPNLKRSNWEKDSILKDFGKRKRFRMNEDVRKERVREKRKRGRIQKKRKRRKIAYIIYTYITNEVLAKTFAHSWDGFRPVSGISIHSFPFQYFNKKEVQKFSLESLDFTANVLYLRYEQSNGTKVSKLFQSICK